MTAGSGGGAGYVHVHARPDRHFCICIPNVRDLDPEYIMYGWGRAEKGYLGKYTKGQE